MNTAFESTPAKERFSIVQERRNTSFTATRVTLGFERIESEMPHTDLMQPFQTPPSTVVLSRESIGKSLVCSGEDWRGRWIRFGVLTDLYEGQIWYRKLDENTFLVDIKFD